MTRNRARPCWRSPRPRPGSRCGLLGAILCVLVLPGTGIGAPADSASRSPVLFSPPLRAAAADTLEARIWIEVGRERTREAREDEPARDPGGQEPVLERGDEVRVYYRVSQDAHVAVAHLSSDGRLRLVLPAGPDAAHQVLAGRDYRVLLRGTGRWRVAERPGVGHFIIVASRARMDFSGLRYSRFEGGWDLGELGRERHRDAYRAAGRLVDLLLPHTDAGGRTVSMAAYRVDG